ENCAGLVCAINRLNVWSAPAFASAPASVADGASEPEFQRSTSARLASDARLYRSRALPVLDALTPLVATRNRQSEGKAASPRCRAGTNWKALTSPALACRIAV